MLKKTRLKQGTLSWEKARETRIGSSEIFDIVRYYATDKELTYCGFNAEDFRNEKPYTTVWALFHKMTESGLYKRETLASEFAEYGHIVEPYGAEKLKEGRQKHRIKVGGVYASNRLIASVDTEGIAEEVDEGASFINGSGHPKLGEKFVCEQKSMQPCVLKNGLPFKYIIQAQYQVMQTEADFFILQLMVLDSDSDFIRGKICGMGKAARFKYFDKHLKVSNIYFKNNTHLARLIEECINRFFADVDARKEPKPFMEVDTAKNVIESIRINALYNSKLDYPYDLSEYKLLKAAEDEAILERKKKLYEIIEIAKEKNVCKFYSEDGTTATFAKDGSFRMRMPKEVM